MFSIFANVIMIEVLRNSENVDIDDIDIEDFKEGKVGQVGGKLVRDSRFADDSFHVHKRDCKLTR